MNPEVTIESRRIEKNMKIGELSTQTGLTVETIRYYEKQGLIPEPARTSNNYRTYTAEHLERLMLIRNCRSLDMSHDEIESLLSYIDTPGDDCSAINKLIEDHLRHVQHRIQELQHLEIQLKHIKKNCSGTHKPEDCTIAKQLSTLEGVSKKRKNHLSNQKELHSYG